MATLLSPSLTSTSHTLSAQTTMPPSANLTNGDALAQSTNGSAATARLLESLQNDKVHTFLQPTASLPTQYLELVKDTLEAFAGDVSDEQQRRLAESRKRKRGGVQNGETLKVRKIWVEGFETEQVWQQARRVINGVLKFSNGALEEMAERGEVAQDDNLSGDEEEDEDDEEEEEEEGDDEDVSEVDMDDFEGFEGSEDMESEEEELEAPIEADMAGEEEVDEDGMEEVEEEEDDAEEYVEDPDGLNDGFFSLDDFNKQSQWFEDQDAKGNPNTDQVSDEEDIDWDADPLVPSKPSRTMKRPSGEEEEQMDEDDEDEDDGPTFGDMSLDAPEGESDDEALLDDEAQDDEANDFNANDVYYKDYFAAPAKKSKNGKPRKDKRFTPKEVPEEDVNRAIEDVRRDLFDDESERSDSEDALSDVSAGDPKSRRSAHERRQAKLAEEIRKLEAESIAKRNWTVSGEAAAVDRPVNSLLEEDLDFEHVGKPVPVITPEISESIEDLIKRRILAQEFDEVIRRRPDTENVPGGTRRGMIELSDSKNDKSLAEIYEEEHIKNTDPDAYVSKSDEKLQKEEKEIEAMWKDVSSRLDSLSSWHFKPKPTAPVLSVVADVGTVSMEDAQPATAQGVAGSSSRMAPQEIYKAGSKENVAKGEVVTKSGLPMAKQEISREDKSRRRRREKERIRKAGGLDGKKILGKKAQMQKDTLADLKKGGVKVINRKGEITDVLGNKAKAAKALSSGNLKL